MKSLYWLLLVFGIAVAVRAENPGYTPKTEQIVDFLETKVAGVKLVCGKIEMKEGNVVHETAIEATYKNVRRREKGVNFDITGKMTEKTYALVGGKRGKLLKVQDVAPEFTVRHVFTETESGELIGSSSDLEFENPARALRLSLNDAGKVALDSTEIFYLEEIETDGSKRRTAQSTQTLIGLGTGGRVETTSTNAVFNVDVSAFTGARPWTLKHTARPASGDERLPQTCHAE